MEIISPLLPAVATLHNLLKRFQSDPPSSRGGGRHTAVIKRTHVVWLHKLFSAESANENSN